MNTVSILNMDILTGKYRMAKRLAVVLTLLGILVPVHAASQDVAVGSATAEVLAAVSVSATQSLGFGNVLQGVPTALANNNASAAIFEVSGQKDSGVELYLQLPEYLSISDNSDRLTIWFSATDASVDTTGAGDPTTMAAGKGWQNTNPHSLPAAAIVGTNGTDIYLGGTVVPSPNQKAGTYSGDIVLTVSYNGN